MYKKSTHDLADIYGPYVRSNKTDKWHWIKECSYYPKVSDPIVRYSSTRPGRDELCTECLQIEKAKH